MKRFTRLAALAVGALGSVIGTVPTAHANTTLDATFVGTVHVAGGIGYTIITLAPQTPSLDCDLPLNGAVTSAIPNCHPEYDHPRGVSLASSAGQCVDAGVNVLKDPKLPSFAGLCSFGGAGEVTGHCDLSGGQWTMTFTNSEGQTFILDLHFTNVVTDLTFTGHWRKSSGDHHGLVTGNATMTEIIEIGGRSCFTKTQDNFILTGTLTLISEPVL